jgi:hypothetical protein
MSKAQQAPDWAVCVDDVDAPGQFVGDADPAGQYFPEKQQERSVSRKSTEHNRNSPNPHAVSVAVSEPIGQ